MAIALVRKPLPKPNPTADPRFRRVMEQVTTGAKRTRAHPPASKKTADAAAAAKGPANERIAAGKTRQVEKIKGAPAKKPEPSSFLALLRAEIEKAMPKTLGDTEKFMQGGKAEQMKGSLKGNVSQQKETATGQVSSASRQQPAPAGEAKLEKPLPKEGQPPPPVANAPEGMPAPKPDADVSLQDSKQNVDAQMKEADVDTPQLQKANDPRFSATADSKAKVAKQADSAPAQYRAQEKTVLGTAAAKAATDARKGAAAMIGVRTASGTRVLTRQQQQKAKDEAKRKFVVDQIESIYNNTKAKVEKKLADLDEEVNRLFDQGTEKALDAMTTFVNQRLRRYKIDRYLSIPIVGPARWIRDQFMGLPDEVNAFYEEGRTVFRAAMDALVVMVANLVERRLKEAKDEVAKGQAEIAKFVASQPKELQAVAQSAQKDVSSRFQELERGIEDKKNELASSLAQKYKEGFDKANEALKKIQDENKGLVAGFVEQLVGVVKALLEFKEKLMAVLRKARDTVKLIIKDPIGFLKNLIAALKGGVNAFKEHIWDHLQRGFMAWLLGNLPPGIELPKDFSLPSILKLVLGVLGITYERMRAKAVKLIGERNVKIIEKVVEYIRTLITGGIAALWEKVKEDLSDLKQMVIDAIQNWIITTIVKQAIQKIVSMFNPVGAIVQAVLAIYNIIMFVVEQAQKILAFIEAVVDSVYNIVTGNIGGAVKKIEDALGRTIPIVIGFLARLLGLSGITQKVHEFIRKVQSRVDRAIDKAIAKIVGMFKKLFGAGGKGAEDEGPVETITEAVNMEGTGHTLTVGNDGVDFATSKGKLSVKIGTAITRVKALSPAPKNLAKRVSTLEALKKRAEGIETDRKADKSKKMTAKLKTRTKSLVEAIKSYAKKYGAKDVENVLTAEFPRTIADVYSKLVSVKDKELPDGRERQDHHAPPVQLAESMAGPLVQAGKALEAEAPGTGDDLLDTGEALKKAKPGDLPAIRLHEQTHKTSGGPGVRVHGSELRPILVQKLITEKNKFALEELSRTSRGKVSVRPGDISLLQQLKSIARRITGVKNIALKRALKQDAKPIVQRMYEAVSEAHFVGVKAALDASIVDGPKGDRTSALTRLKSLATKIWKNKLLGKFHP